MGTTTRNVGRWGAGLAVTGLVCAVTTPTSGAVEEAGPRLGTNAIVFSSLRAEGSGTNDDIYVRSVGGAGERRLTTAEGQDGAAVVSPDRRTIAFGSERTGLMQLWVMDADGSDQRQLLDSGSFDFHPAWSHDGGSILFQRLSDDDRIRPVGPRPRHRRPAAAHLAAAQRGGCLLLARRPLGRVHGQQRREPGRVACARLGRCPGRADGRRVHRRQGAVRPGRRQPAELDSRRSHPLPERPCREHGHLDHGDGRLRCQRGDQPGWCESGHAVDVGRRAADRLLHRRPRPRRRCATSTPCSRTAASCVGSPPPVTTSRRRSPPAADWAPFPALRQAGQRACQAASTSASCSGVTRRRRGSRGSRARSRRPGAAAARPPRPDRGRAPACRRTPGAAATAAATLHPPTVRPRAPRGSPGRPT